MENVSGLLKLQFRHTQVTLYMHESMTRLCHICLCYLIKSSDNFTTGNECRTNAGSLLGNRGSSFWKSSTRHRTTRESILLNSVRFGQASGFPRYPGEADGLHLSVNGLVSSTHQMEQTKTTKKQNQRIEQSLKPGGDWINKDFSVSFTERFSKTHFVLSLEKWSNCIKYLKLCKSRTTSVTIS